MLNGEPIDDEGRKRVGTVLDLIRERSGIDSGARIESENNFASNVGLGASASGFAALAQGATTASGLELSREELSVLARRGSGSAARSIVGGFSHLRVRTGDERVTAEPISDSFDEEIRIVVGLIPEYKRTSRAHATTPESPMFDGRLSHVSSVRQSLRKAIQKGDFTRTFGLAEQDSLHLLAVTMTGDEGWVYWRPETLRLLQLARGLREEGLQVYFSVDTGATVYLNTTAEHVDRVVEEVQSLGLRSRVWRVGGRTKLVDDHLF